jgi:uncharacterized protein (TIRG00374 family)
MLPMVTATVLLIVALPHATGCGWTPILTALGGVSLLGLGALGLLWGAGLLSYMVVLTAALPGLTIRRALLISLTGSAVSNLLPMGGAVGTALNYSMCRRWGHPPAAFVLFSVVTHIWGLIAKLSLPALAMLALLLCDRSSTSPGLPAALALLVLAVLLAALCAVLARESIAAAAGRLVDIATDRAGRIVGRSWKPNVEQQTRSLRAQTICLTRRDWRRPALGLFGHATSHALLLWMCLHTVGSTVDPLHVFAAFAIERLLTVVVVTPGGIGVVELVMTAMLTGFGGSPASVAAGVLLYRAFTFALNIPVGGVLLLGWLARYRRTVAPVESTPDFGTLSTLPVPDPVLARAAA